VDAFDVGRDKLKVWVYDRSQIPVPVPAKRLGEALAVVDEVLNSYQFTFVELWGASLAEEFSRSRRLQLECAGL
jgi:hypothetical protein